jgi:uncharacterized membrane protein YfcA
MDSVYWVYGVVALGAATAGFVQGLSGFAFGMVSMSFWIWVVEPQMAAAMAVFGALLGQIVAAFSVRRGARWAVLLPFVMGGLIGIPIGVYLLPRIDTQWFRILLGTVLVLWCPVMLLSRQLPRWNAGGRWANALVGMCGGMMGGLGGLSGTLPTLWCTLRGFDKDMQRAVIQNFNLATLAVTMGVYVTTGLITRETLPMLAIVAPAMLLPTLLGTRLYAGISEARFRQMVLGLLTVSGILLLTSGISGLLRHAG